MSLEDTNGLEINKNFNHGNKDLFITGLTSQLLDERLDGEEVIIIISFIGDSHTSHHYHHHYHHYHHHHHHHYHHRWSQEYCLRH